MAWRSIAKSLGNALIDIPTYATYLKFGVSMLELEFVAPSQCGRVLWWW